MRNQRDWKKATKQNPCPACGSPDWCMHDERSGLCNRDQVPDGCHDAGQQDGGARLWFRDAPAAPNGKTTERKAKPPALPVATSGECDRVYRRALELMPVPAAVAKEVAEQRGFTTERLAELAFGYLPGRGKRRSDVLETLEREFGRDLLRKVPGFVVKGEKLDFALSGAGLIIPHRDRVGNVVALQARLDRVPEGKPRYQWLSGAGGPSVSAACYLAGEAVAGGRVVITEGAFKAIAGAARFDTLAIGLSGASMLGQAFPVLKDVGAREALLAYDADHAEPNTDKQGRPSNNVFGWLRSAVTNLRAEGYTVSLLRWHRGLFVDGETPKGLDDAIQAGADLEELHGDQVDQHLREVAELLEMAEEVAPLVEGWGTPSPFGSASLPQFPLEIFAPWASSYLKALSSTLKTPSDFGGMFFLGGLAITNQKRFRLLVKMGWKEPLPLWVLVAAPSGSRKSQAFKEVMRPWANWETWIGEEFAPIRKRAARQIKDLTIEIELLKKKKAPSSVIAEKEEELDGLFVPASPRLYTGTGTPEAIETKLAEHGGRYALANAESDILSVMMGKYRSGGTPPIEGFLSAYSGEPLKSDYQTRDDVNVPEAHLSMVLATQPDNAADLYSRQKLASRGAFARFMTVLPVTSGRMTWDEERVPEEVERAYLEGVAKLLPTFAEVSEQYCSGSIPLRELRFSAPAKKVFSAFFERVETGKAVGGDLQFLEEWAAKLCGQCARIAALLHLSDTPGDVHLEVSRSAVERAVHLAESYLIPHAKAVFGFESAPQIEKVWSVLHAHGPEMTRKELNRAVKPMAAPDIDAALESLEERKFIKVEKRPTGKSGKPPTFILVNPNAGPPGTNGTNPLIQTNPVKSTESGHSEAWHLLGTNSALIPLEGSNGSSDQLVGNKCHISAKTEIERKPSNEAVSRISGISGISARDLETESPPEPNGRELGELLGDLL